MNQAHVNAYCAAKTATGDVMKAVKAAIAAGASHAEAGAVSWAVEKGKAAPAYGLYADGRETTRLESSMLAAGEDR